MKSSLVRKRLLQAAGLTVVALVLILIAAGNVVVRGGRNAEVVRAELAAKRPALRTEAGRAEVIGLARGTRSRAPAPPASAGTSPPPDVSVPRDLMHPSHDASFGRDPAERPIHEWLQAVRLSRSQPGPAPPPGAAAVLAGVAPALDALAEQLSRAVAGESAMQLHRVTRDR